MKTISTAKGKSIDELKVGDSAQISKTITEGDIELFAKATGDFNPVHLDQAYAGKTMFKCLKEELPMGSSLWVSSLPF